VIYTLLLALILASCTQPQFHPAPRLGLAPVPTCAGCLPAYPSHDDACRNMWLKEEQKE
jgi:hypothetical protein